MQPAGGSTALLQSIPREQERNMGLRAIDSSLAHFSYSIYLGDMMEEIECGVCVCVEDGCLKLKEILNFSARILEVYAGLILNF